MTKSSINVVFPVVALNSLAGQEGFAQDAEYGEQTKAIKFYVNQINAKGGINGRKVNAIIANFNPTNESEMRSLCKTWTEGSPAGLRRAGRGGRRGPATISCASRRRGTPPSSASGAR